MGGMFGSKPKVVQAADPVLAATPKTVVDKPSRTSASKRKASFGINDTFMNAFLQGQTEGKTTLG